MNGQVVGARVNEVGLSVIKDDGRGSWGARRMDRDEKVMGNRDCEMNLMKWMMMIEEYYHLFLFFSHQLQTQHNFKFLY